MSNLQPIEYDEDELMLFSHFNSTTSSKKSKKLNYNPDDYVSFIVNNNNSQLAKLNDHRFYDNPYKNYQGKRKLQDKNIVTDDLAIMSKTSSKLNQKLNAIQKFIYYKDSYQISTNYDYRNYYLIMREDILKEIQMDLNAHPGFYRSNNVDTNNFKKQHYKEERKHYKTYMNAIIKSEFKCTWDEVCEERRLVSTAHLVNKVLKYFFGDSTPYQLKEKTVY